MQGSRLKCRALKNALGKCCKRITHACQDHIQSKALPQNWLFQQFLILLPLCLDSPSVLALHRRAKLRRHFPNIFVTLLTLSIKFENIWKSWKMRNFHFLLKTNFHAKNGQNSTRPNMYEVIDFFCTSSCQKYRKNELLDRIELKLILLDKVLMGFGT